MNTSHLTAPAVAAATFINAPQKGDYEAVINLLDTLGEANRALDALQSKIEAGYIELIKPHRETYAALQAKVSETEAALEVITRRNPQWFKEQKTVKTPFGDVKFTSSSELIVADENVSVQLIQALAGRDDQGKENAPKYLRTVIVLNKEALENLSDEQLARYAIVRKKKENFAAKTEVVDLGNAVAAAERSERAAKKAAKKAADSKQEAA